MKRAAPKHGYSRARRTSQTTLAAAKVTVWTRDGGECVICGARGWEFHHRLPRGMGGANFDPQAHSPARLVVLCQDCHTRCESERDWAEKKGYLLRHGLTGCADTPILYRGRWELLLDDGGFEHVYGVAFMPELDAS